MRITPEKHLRQFMAFRMDETANRTCRHWLQPITWKAMKAPA
jgi:hypothetical protein